ncbi:MAG: hypothetical protein F6K26_05430 [Moorea sp. SIO2I5]|nr:hypothetical protein [Moorena sp. SIO2I5]
MRSLPLVDMFTLGTVGEGAIAQVRKLRPLATLCERFRSVAWPKANRFQRLFWSIAQCPSKSS